MDVPRAIFMIRSFKYLGWIHIFDFIYSKIAFTEYDDVCMKLIHMILHLTFGKDTYILLNEFNFISSVSNQ